MTLTVIDGDFPREVIAEQNLTFADFRMAARLNNDRKYDAKLHGPAPVRRGRRISSVELHNSFETQSAKTGNNQFPGWLSLGATGLLLLVIGSLTIARGH